MRLLTSCVDGGEYVLNIEYFPVKWHSYRSCAPKLVKTQYSTAVLRETKSVLVATNDQSLGKTETEKKS